MYSRTTAESICSQHKQPLQQGLCYIIWMFILLSKTKIVSSSESAIEYPPFIIATVLPPAEKGPQEHT